MCDVPIEPTARLLPTGEPVGADAITHVLDLSARETMA